MIKYLIQISDIHIRLYQRQEEYQEQFIKFYKELDKLRKKIDSKEGRIIVTGDLFHQKITISNESTRVCTNFLKEISKRFKTIIIPGNHDTLIGNKNRLDSISPIVESLSNENIWYLKESGDYEDENLVYVVWSCLEEQKNPQLKKYKEKYDPDNKKTYITLFHGIISGAKNDIGFQFTDGLDIKEFTGSDMICLGDVHLHQKLELKENNRIIPAVYSGSYIVQNFGENNEKGYVLWEIKSKNDIPYEFKKIETDYGFFTIELNSFDNLNNNSKEKNLNISKKPNIRVIWKDSSNSYSSIRQNEIKEHYQNKYNPINLTVIFESTDSNELMNIDKNNSENISNPEIQKKLILDYLINNNQIDDEELEVEIDSELPEEEKESEEFKPVSFDSL